MNSWHPEIVLPEDEIKRALRRKTRRDFLVGGLAAIGAFGGYKWVRSRKREDGLQWPERKILDMNGQLAHSYFSDSHLMPTYSRSDVGWLKPNGDIGMDEDADPDPWVVKVIADENGSELNLSLADVKALPKTEMITRFCCIEGWSAIAYWGGARFSDFTRKYFRPDLKLTNFVYMATPGEDYYVGLDMKSAMHPQTLLAYEHDGKPLADEHGAPLRLVIPGKYGIKSIKRLGFIQYTNERPADYWGEQGYDWFAGL
ncbi:MAG: molybdopterin-dependent oxidoreductase [Acidobacteriaceae bacterium]|nr:molybdopterin-dependent oxidoreductase [Acidobacteriaceae bacterium]MBV9778865.1 molybdopterin-dependent oxidoreductase [Acidobacteriaceae bacterium]